MSEIESLRPALAVAVGAVATVLIIASYRWPDVRESWTILAAFTKFGVVASMIPGVLAGDVYVTELGMLAPGVDLTLRADPLGMLFAVLASFLWIWTSFYSIGYMRGLSEHGQTRYFASFAASLMATMGIAFSDNLLTLFIFYELLTVATYPLVAHDESKEARDAGRKYLAYTFGGGVAVLAGTVLVYALVGTVSFEAGGIAGLAAADPVLSRVAFVLLAGGFAVKAAVMPVHSWLPDAMVAPTPVSGLLHAVAVVKSGAFGVARTILDVFGPVGVGELGLGVWLAAFAAFTFIAASVIALRKDNLKRRLAFSTIAQLSYIVMGVALLVPHALVGGLMHIPAHAFMKLTLFFCAGCIHVETHTDDISEMAGIGKRMPLTLAAFAVAAFGMAGIPLVAGFVSKWYLMMGAFEAAGAAGEASLALFAVALVVSGILNIAYFWPIVYQAFFEDEDEHDPKPLVDHEVGGYWGGKPDHYRPNLEDAEAVADGGGEHVGDAEVADAAGHEDIHDDTADHDHDHHTQGPPPGGWPRAGWRGGESTWYMLAPILLVCTGAVALGLLPYELYFLEVVDVIVESMTGEEVVR